MPPNLGGFFMVRSYYPSECHADYFDFERIEALKPAIEACGISTLSQSPMLVSSSKGPKPLQLKLLTTYIPKTSAFTLAFSTSQRLRTTRASARTFFTF